MFNLFRRAKPTFLDHDALASIRQLRNNGELIKAEKLLLHAEPTPAVLDELRKIASERARLAKRSKDWKAVVQALEGYERYAEKCRKHCLQIVNAEPPPHTAKDQQLLAEARSQLRG